ncbi:hypothetical protein N431DRAFT_448828 [Stipitochalara longipes BDJ]|nr:hypothetical protein N431DRAFT_448828 [Stipitochalara longipes BDJ]
MARRDFHPAPYFVIIRFLVSLGMNRLQLWFRLHHEAASFMAEVCSRVFGNASKAQAVSASKLAVSATLRMKQATESPAKFKGKNSPDKSVLKDKPKVIQGSCFVDEPKKAVLLARSSGHEDERGFLPQATASFFGSSGVGTSTLVTGAGKEVRPKLCFTHRKHKHRSRAEDKPAKLSGDTS